MKPKHTPGPWVIGRVYRAGTGEFRSIFTSRDKKPGWIGPSHICDLSGDTKEQADANARLVAAAPTMLDTLKLARGAISLGCESTLDIIDRLIKTVEGE